MFNRKTLFIVGAGAGVDVNLPVGRDLALEIAKRTKIVLDHFGRIREGTADDHLALSFFERQRPNINETIKAFRLIQNGILLANSIDDFLNVHENSPEVVQVGKAAIVRCILFKERHSTVTEPYFLRRTISVSRPLSRVATQTTIGNNLHNGPSHFWHNSVETSD